MLLPTLWNSMFATILLASLACVSVPAVAAEAQINSKVAAGKWKAVRLKNLPEGASLGVKVIATGSLVVTFVHETELKRYAAPVSPLFQDTLDKTLIFRVAIPDHGNYFVILDNRRGASERQVRVLIQAKAPKSRQSPSSESNVKKEKI